MKARCARAGCDASAGQVHEALCAYCYQQFQETGEPRGMGWLTWIDVVCARQPERKDPILGHFKTPKLFSPGAKEVAKRVFDQMQLDDEELRKKWRRELPQQVKEKRKQIRAQAQLLKEMGQHQNFCDRIFELFEMQEDLELEPSAELAFEEFWNSLPESRDVDTDQLSIARLRHIVHDAFRKRFNGD